MSPDKSTRSSPKERLHTFSQSPSVHPIEELESHFSKLELRDVQVDDQVTITRWSRKQYPRGSDRRRCVNERKKKILHTKPDTSSGWDIEDTTKCDSKYKREEAKITAWENLQKARAETAIRKLEMKLEKKRSSSMDKITNKLRCAQRNAEEMRKITNKLRCAQRKAEEMRSAVDTIQSKQDATSAHRTGYFSKTGRIRSLRVLCFTCPGF